MPELQRHGLFAPAAVGQFELEEARGIRFSVDAPLAFSGGYFDFGDGLLLSGVQVLPKNYAGERHTGVPRVNYQCDGNHAQYHGYSSPYHDLARSRLHAP